MLKKMEENKLDIVYGSRYTKGGGVEGWPLKRKIISIGANTLSTSLLGIPYSDVTGSFRLYRRPILEKLIGETKNVGFGFQMEIISRAYWKGYKVDSFPIVFVERIFGESKFGPTEVQRFLVSIWQLLKTDRLK